MVLEPLVPLPLGCLVLPWLLVRWLLAAPGWRRRRLESFFISLHPSPSDAHLSCNGGRVAQLLRGGSWINNPHNARAGFRNSNHPDNVNTNIGVRPGCFSPPAPFTVRAVGRDSSGRTRRVQTRSGDRRTPLARSAPSQRPHDPHSPGPLPHGPRPGLPGGLLLSGCSHPPHLPPRHGPPAAPGRRLSPEPQCV